MDETHDLGRLLTRLSEGGVEFILVGGLAATAPGSAHITFDLDVVYRRTPDNMKRLAATVAPINPYLRGAPEGLPFDFDAPTIKRGLNFTLQTELGDLDLLGEIAGGGTFDELLADTEVVRVFDHDIRCVTLPRLIALKRAAGRRKDLNILAELEALFEERERQA